MSMARCRAAARTERIGANAVVALSAPFVPFPKSAQDFGDYSAERATQVSIIAVVPFVSYRSTRPQSNRPHSRTGHFGYHAAAVDILASCSDVLVPRAVAPRGIA